MKNHAQISPITIGKTVTIEGITTEIINYLHLTAITTKQMADFYRCGEEVILNNFNNNRDRFIEGEHFINITGNSNWSKVPTNLISPNDTTPMLWLLEGASRHAMMLANSNYDAWFVFRQLEVYYFNKDIEADGYASFICCGESGIYPMSARVPRGHRPAGETRPTK